MIISLSHNRSVPLLSDIAISQYGEAISADNTSSLFQRIGSAILHPFACLLDCLCHYNPVRKQYEFLALCPEKLEFLVGAHLHDKNLNKRGVCNDPEITAIAERAFKRLVPVEDRKLEYKITVSNSHEVNAICYSDGRIIMHRGLIEAIQREQRDFGLGHIPVDDKVAAVIGHEITHFAARHAARQKELGVLAGAAGAIGGGSMTWQLLTVLKVCLLAKVVFVGITLAVVGLCAKVFYSYIGQQNELEADKYGMVYLNRAGFDPRAELWYSNFLLAQDADAGGDLFSTHPNAATRIAEDRKTLQLIESGQLA